MMMSDVGTEKKKKPQRTAETKTASAHDAANLVAGRRDQHTPDDGTVEVLPYLSSRPAETALQGIIDDKARWLANPDGGFSYGDSTGTYVTFGDQPSEIRQHPAETTLQKLLELDDSTAQTFIYVMAKDLASPTPGVKTRISVNELLTWKGYRRHNSGDFITQQKRDEQNRLLALNDIRVTVSDVIKVPSGKSHKQKRIRVQSRLVEMEIETEDTSSAKGALAKQGLVDVALELPFSTINTVPYAFRINLGGWSKDYREASGVMQTVLSKIGQYDSNREFTRYAMRIMFALMFSRARGQTKWPIGDLLQKARIERPTHHFERFRQAIEDGLDRLVADHLIGFWQWAPGTSEESLPGKRWMEKWLKWEIVIGMPQSQIAATGIA
jgi:hypothetical protein